MADGNLELFRRCLEAEGPELDLGEAALRVASMEYPELDVPAYVVRLDRIADEAPPECRRGDVLDRLRALGHYLGEQLDLRGDTDQYYDPRNSYLNDVLERRRGLPITLSVVYLEVARRIGLPMDGVGFPGHFLVRHRRERAVHVDPFGGGRMLTETELGSLVAAFSGGRLRLSEQHLRAVTPRQIVQRMLHNLHAIHRREKDLPRLLGVLDRLRIVAPDHAALYLERGRAALVSGRLDDGVADLRTFLLLRPSVRRRSEIEQAIVRACRR